MLASDLAVLYGVQPKVLVQAVKRNIERFPLDFAFPLTEQEVKVLRSQIVTLDEAPAGRGKVVFDAIRELMTPPAPAPKRKIGFVRND